MTDRPGIGVIIGRFQVPELHLGHKELLHRAAEHQATVVVMCSSPFGGTQANPLDFPTRRAMIQQYMPGGTVVLHQMDRTLNEEWAKEVLTAVEEAFPHQPKTFYYGRDTSACCLLQYAAGWTCTEIDNVQKVTGTEERAAVWGKVPLDFEGRAAAIYAARNRYPVALMAVDIAMFKTEEAADPRYFPNKVSLLLGRKAGEEKWRLPGGFVAPGECLEGAAARELREETSQSPEGPMIYAGSFPVEDWREQADMRITSALFLCSYTHGPIKAGDDLVEVRWWPVEELYDSNIHGPHNRLIHAAIDEGGY